MDMSTSSTPHLRFGSASTDTSSLPDSRWNLVTFLCIAQTLSVDLLPITWHSALEQAGIGATATLRERLVNVSLSLLFKRVHPRHFAHLPEAVAERMTFKTLSTEMWIARHHGVVKSPYLINLEGVSWDVEKDGRVWPVLVYEKAEHGSLEEFLKKTSVTSSHTSALTSFSEKVQICAQIAQGIATLHKAAIIHGDVKPDNILVFSTAAREPTAKLTDFGFSTFCLSSWKEGPLLREGVYVKDRIFLTKYSFWSHPNRHEDGYNFEEAIREEVYSFGMTCFWVFFSQSTAIPSEAGITFAKMRGQMLTLCSELAQTPEMGLSRDQIAFLARFFEATLSHEAHRRCASHEIISLFETKTETSDATWTQSFGISIPENSNLIMPEFSLIKSLGQLLAIDYRVRAYIRSCFLDILKEETNPEVLRRTHFAVACCYELGFGGLADQTRRDAHLQQSGSSLEELETQLRDFKSTKGVVYFEGQFRTAMESGLIPPLDMVQALRDVPTSSDLATLMRVEIDNMERVLGVASTHIVHMKSMLANLYWEHGQTKLARDMLLACLCALENNADDVDHWDLLFVKGAVAEAETRVGNWDTAEDLLRGLIEEVTALGGRDHSETIVVKNQLALALADSGKWEEAVPLQKELREVQKERLGVGHPLTLQFTTPLLQSLIELGEYDEAEELMENIKSLRDAVWGKDSQDTLLSLMDEARLLDARGLYEEAEDVERMALERCQQSLEQDHPYTLDCMMNLALTLIHRVGIEEAEGLAKQCVAAYVRVKGERNPDTLRSRSSLAMIYKELGNWREAMNEDLQAYQGLQQELGLVHPFTLASMHGLGQDYWKLNKLNEAEEVLVQALRGQIDALGEDHRETIETKTMLGNVYAELENLEDATAMLESALASSKRKWGDDNRDTLIAAMNLATVYDDAGHVQKAIDLEEESLTKAREHLDPHDPITLTLITNLAMSYMTPSIYRHEDGVRLAEEAVRTRSTLGEDGGNAEGLAHAQNGLAQVYTRVGRLEEAKDLHELAFASRLEMFGEEHPDTEMSADKLQEVRTMLAQRQMYIT